MKSLPRSACSAYLIDGAAEPVLTVGSGESFCVCTEDASSGLLTSGTVVPTLDNTPYALKTPARSNPVVGPVYVEGARVGSVLSVDVLDIELAPTGVVYSRPSSSHLGDSRQWAVGSESFAVSVRHDAGLATITERLTWPTRPMIGTIACAPEWEPRASSVGQGPWGGNIDVPDVTAGATIMLPVFVDGAMLYLGDVHGSQGDGEFIGVGDESRARVTLRASASGEPAIEFPRIVTDDQVIALGIDRPLESAAQRAVTHMMTWLTDGFGFSPRDAYVLVGIHPEFRLRIYQMTAMSALSFVVGAALPRAVVASS